MRHGSWEQPSSEVIPEKLLSHEDIQADIDAFLARGGRIEQAQTRQIHLASRGEGKSPVYVNSTDGLHHTVLPGTPEKGRWKSAKVGESWRESPDVWAIESLRLRAKHFERGTGFKFRVEKDFGFYRVTRVA